jgi:hypothetical protein
MADSINTTQQAFKDVYDELTRLSATNADLSLQVQRIQRSIKIDEREKEAGQEQSARELTQAVTRLTVAVNQMLIEQRTAETGEARFNADGVTLHRLNVDRQSRDARKRLNYIRQLADLRQVDTPKCPCGNHSGIRFVNKQGDIIEDNMCPKEWWIKQSRLAFENGKLDDFVSLIPMKDYLFAYKLKI